MPSCTKVITDAASAKQLQEHTSQFCALDATYMISFGFVMVRVYLIASLDSSYTTWESVCRNQCWNPYITPYHSKSVANWSQGAKDLLHFLGCDVFIHNLISVDILKCKSITTSTDDFGSHRGRVRLQYLGAKSNSVYTRLRLSKPKKSRPCLQSANQEQTTPQCSLPLSLLHSLNDNTFNGPQKHAMW